MTAGGREEMDRRARCGSFAEHINAVGGNNNRICASKHGEIGIVASAVPDKGALRRKRDSQSFGEALRRAS